jgi:cobyrinic acid a,c-diamide synthase
MWGLPVLGALEQLSPLRQAVRQLSPGSSVPREVCEHLAAALERYTRPETIRRLAARREFDAVPTSLFQPVVHRRPMTVAVAYDEAFHCYFPDTLDLLESFGATIVDFSPLHDESLPPEADLVYIGCGRPERFSAELSENHCMMLALRNHLCAGRRIYADGGGLAYLCQFLETPEGKWASMVGILPAIAHLNRNPGAPQPVEVTVSQPSWLADPGTPLRGYLNSTWRIESNGQLHGFLAEAGHQFDLVGRYQALASRLQVNFATQPGFLRHFLEPAAATVRHPALRTIV